MCILVSAFYNEFMSIDSLQGELFTKEYTVAFASNVAPKLLD